jgi:4-alpha-glucanotransferase
MASSWEQLLQLADFLGVQTSYYDVTGQLQHATAEALVPVLHSLGARVDRVDDAHEAYRHSLQERWRRWVEPVAVAWDGRPAELLVRLPASCASNVCCALRLETGEVREWNWEAEHASLQESAQVEKVWYQARRLTLPETMPSGYHQLVLSSGGKRAECLILSAPSRSYERSDAEGQSSWGVFLPLYALHSERSWGAGDLTDLEALTEWVSGLGGGIVATLPLLAAFLEEPFEPGPYSPASRLFWNEFYLDVARIPELKDCSQAQALMNGRDFQQEVTDLQAEPLVDYRRQMALKRRVLAELARAFFARSSGQRREELRRFLAGHPQTEDYARFRAAGEKRRAPWPAWPEALKAGRVMEEDYDEENKNYHIYVQWQAHEQLQRLAATARSSGHGFYLDLPLGVNPDSYDVWREREAFATGIAAGAPPDPFFAKGQNWGFPPLHPELIREQGYRYVVSYLRHHLQLAGVLRIDHMMGFHRLFWVPHGQDARAGIYVRYPAEELYAVFSLESHRSRSVLVGEDLGTVPPEVRPTMERHNVHRMYVLQYELQPQYHNALTQVYPGSVASLNTHDMPPFAAFWQGLDVQERIQLGILDGGIGNEERQRRRGLLEALIRSLRIAGRLHDSTETIDVLQACLNYMSAGPGQMVLANLEDFWLETESQNVPGTWRERPNWRRKARYSLEAMRERPEVVRMLREMNQIFREHHRSTPASTSQRQTR